MKIKYNQITVHYGEPIQLDFPVEGTILTEYTEVTMNIRGGGNSAYTAKIPLTVDTTENSLSVNIENTLAAGRYYFEIVGKYADNKLNTFTERPLYLEVLPAL